MFKNEDILFQIYIFSIKLYSNLKIIVLLNNHNIIVLSETHSFNK